MKSPVEVDLQDHIPFFLGHVEDHAVAQDTGVVDQDVYPAEDVEAVLMMFSPPSGVATES